MPKTEIVETVTGRTMADLLTARDQATGDLVELRLDGVADLDVRGALAGRRRPVIATCRASWEGGAFDGPEETRLGVLADAIRLGAEFVDVEWKADRRGLPRGDRTRLVVSHHDFTGLPHDLADRVRAMAATGADIVKVAVMPARLSDCLTLREVVRLDLPHVTIAMGGRGLLTRLCPWIWGSCWSFGGAAAPGQIPASDLRAVYRVHDTSAATTLYGVAGDPLRHSASPAMHNPALVASGLDAVYVPFETDDADDLLAVAEALDARGLSVTAPLKTSTFARAAAVDELGAAIGAINTLRRAPDGSWEGRNFDVAGFLAPLDRRGEALNGRAAVVLGAGGAGRTAVWALRSRGARVSVAARRADQATALADALGGDVAVWPPAPGWDLLVNTTPVGTWPHVDDCPIPAATVRGGCVYDLIYNPPRTALLQAAARAGAATIGGLEMLVGQACEQFAWWTGRPAPASIMTEAAHAFVVRAQAER